MFVFRADVENGRRIETVAVVQSRPGLSLNSSLFAEAIASAFSPCRIASADCVLGVSGPFANGGA